MGMLTCAREDDSVDLGFRAKVVIGDINGESAAVTAQEINSLGG